MVTLREVQKGAGSMGAKVRRGGIWVVSKYGEASEDRDMMVVDGEKEIAVEDGAMDKNSGYERSFTWEVEMADFSSQALPYF